MKTLKILVADDDEGIRVWIKEFLKPHQVVMATNGEEGLEIFGRNLNFDLLITDRKMPGMFGEKLIKRVKDLKPDVKAILMTSDVENIEIIRKMAIGGTAGGPDRFLPKPFAEEELMEAIQSLFPGLFPE